MFDLPDLVRFGLGRDPLRAGHQGAAGLWAQQPDGAERLQKKLHADLQDLAELKARILDAALPAAPPTEAAPASAPPA